MELPQLKRLLRFGAAVVAVGAMTVSTAVPAAAEFVDDDGRPGERALEWLADRGVIHGCDPPDNRASCPDRELTRAEAAKILVLLGQQEGSLEDGPPAAIDHFEDDDTMWRGAAGFYADHLASAGVIHGCDPPHNRRFCPQDTLRRGHIVKMVVRLFDLEAPDSYTSPWTDTAGHYFEEEARVAAFAGIIDASSGVFDGYRSVTRAEFARLVVAVFEPDLCSADPFTAGRVAALQSAHPGIDFTAYVYDLRTGCAYAMDPGSRQQSASVFKVMVMGGTLLEAQRDGRALTPRESSLLRSMITESANSPVRDLWRSFGGPPWFSRQAELFGLDETTVLGDHHQIWGRTRTSAYDQAKLLRQVLLGEGGLMGERYREVAHDLMTSVVPSQRWGVSQGVPAGWTVALKNGFAGQIANSVGVVYDASGEPVYVAAILTFGWPTWERGVAAVEEIGGWISGAFAD